MITTPAQPQPQAPSLKAIYAAKRSAKLAGQKALTQHYIDVVATHRASIELKRRLATHRNSI